MFSSIGKTLQSFQNKFSNRNHLRSTFIVFSRYLGRKVQEASIKVNNIPICLLQVGGSYRSTYTGYCLIIVSREGQCIIFY